MRLTDKKALTRTIHISGSLFHYPRAKWPHLKERR